MFAQSSFRQHNCTTYIPTLAHATVVCPDVSNAHQRASSSTKEQTDLLTKSAQETAPTSSSQAMCLQAVRGSTNATGISNKAFNIICHSWRKGTQKQYGSVLQKWSHYCKQRNINYYSPTVSEVLDFLVSRYEEGLGYSALNTARSALSTIICHGTLTIGAHPLIIRFMKGVYNLRPPQARYSAIWDPTVVLKYLKTLAPAKFLSLKDLTLKLVVLMALVSVQRAQSLHLLNINTMKRHRSYVTFSLSSPLKQSRPGVSVPVLEFRAYAPDRRLCVVTYITEYLKRTKSYRNDSKSQFFLSYSRTREPVSKPTISRWIKTMLHRAGIPINFKAHSTRAASSTSAWQSAIPIEDILQKAGWSSGSTFAKYYKKPIRKRDVSTALLDQA